MLRSYVCLIQNNYESYFLSLQGRQVQRNLCFELKKRKDAGESDLIIRRGKIIKINVSTDTAMSVDVSTLPSASDCQGNDHSG